MHWERIDGQRELDLGCVVATHARQRGYAAEASEAVVRARSPGAFERLGARTGPDNAAALDVPEKLEFVPNGETTFEDRRCAFFLKGAPSTCHATVAALSPPIGVSVRACPPARAAPA